MYIAEFMEGLDGPLFCLEEIIEKHKLDHEHWGLPVIKFEGKEHAVALGEDIANEAAGKCIKESLYTFDSHIIANYTEFFPVRVIEKILKLDADANDIIAAIIVDIDDFIENAISNDGRGFFLATADLEERKLYFANEIIYLYRLE